MLRSLVSIGIITTVSIVTRSLESLANIVRVVIRIDTFNARTSFLEGHAGSHKGFRLVCIGVGKMCVECVWLGEGCYE